jgi:hypothetical protein
MLAPLKMHGHRAPLLTSKDDAGRATGGAFSPCGKLGARAAECKAVVRRKKLPLPAGETHRAGIKLLNTKKYHT